MAPTEKNVPAEALLIRRARQALGLSPERIVERLKRVKMTGRNWRLVESGRAAPDDTIAHMAYVAGVDAAQLAEARPEAAEILREIQRQEAQAPDRDGMTREEFIELLRNDPQARAEFFDALLDARARSTGADDADSGDSES